MVYLIESERRKLVARLEEAGFMRQSSTPPTYVNDGAVVILDGFIAVRHVLGVGVRQLIDWEIQLGPGAPGELAVAALRLMGVTMAPAASDLAVWSVWDGDQCVAEGLYLEDALAHGSKIGPRAHIANKITGEVASWGDKVPPTGS